MQLKRIYFLLILAFGTAACANMEREVDITLPEFRSELVVECYIERNKPVRVAVSETQDYFKQVDLPFLDSTTIVTITYNGQSQRLKYNLDIDPFDFKLFNFIMPDSIPMMAGERIYIEVKDTQGRIATAETAWIDPVELDSVSATFNKEERAALLAHFRDPGATTDFYRFRVRNFTQRDSVTGRPRRGPDYFTTDDIFNGNKTTLGGPPNNEKGDTVEVTLYRMTREYYDFLNTAVSAADGNGNPFATPATIKSNVKGGTGIFTTLPYSRKVLIIE